MHTLSLRLYATALLLLMFVMFASALTPAALASESKLGYAVVNNADPDSKLHLRAEPKSSAVSFGRYCNGVKVAILEKTSKEWVKVRVGSGAGSATGYMMSKYLAFGGAGDSVESSIPIMYIRNSSMPLRSDRSLEAQTLETYFRGAAVEVIGYCSTWYHVRIGDMLGFMPNSALTNVQVEEEIYPYGGTATSKIGMSVTVNNPEKDDRLNLRVTPSSSAPTLGKYYNGAAATIVDEPGETWVKVRVGFSEEGYQEGYFKREYLAFGEEGSYVESNIQTFYSVGDNWSLYTKPDSKSDTYGPYNKSIKIERLGVKDTDGWWHVRITDDQGQKHMGWINSASMKLKQ